LWSGERAAAFQLDLEAGGILYHLKPGYDEELARFSPGRLLTEDVLREAFARNLAGYEFLGAAARHKLEWTRRVREQLLLQAFAPTPAGLAELAAFRLGRPAAARALGASRRAVGALRR
jgi:CelD/BcsL family acetyltransferase involved in cellulose biosynthesis